VSYVYSIVTIVAIFSVLTLALNLQFGQAGIVNFGLVAYFAVGAYGYAILTQPPPSEIDHYVVGLELSPWLAAPLAILASVAVAFVLGLPALRLRPEYLALATFAFAQVLESLLVNVRALANGNVGLSGLEPPGAASIPFESYDAWVMIAAIVMLAIVYGLVSRLTSAPFGAALRATRDDPLAAAAIAKSVAGFRMRSFLVGCGLAGFAGVAYASYTTLAVPELFTANVTFTAFIALMIGGLGSNLGAVVGAAIFFGLEELLNLLPLEGDSAQLVASAQIIPFGLALILVLRFAPQGIVGSLPRRTRRAGGTL
jgi:branched-chain amino acid transport system permease protein